MTEIALDILKNDIEHREGAKYMRLIAAFEDAIRRGDYSPGDRVPTEMEMAARLPVSLGTLQKAMRSLARSGLVVRNRRTGTFIADRKSQMDQAYVYRFRDPETGEYMIPTVRALEVTLDGDDGPWAEVLGVSPCIRVERLVSVGLDPPAFASMYISPEYGESIINATISDLHGSSCHKLMAEKFELPTLRMEHRVSCRKLSKRACSHLHLRSGDVGLVWDVADYSFDDIPILFQRFEMPRDHRPMELTEMRG